MRAQIGSTQLAKFKTSADEAAQRIATSRAYEGLAKILCPGLLHFKETQNRLNEAGIHKPISKGQVPYDTTENACFVASVWLGYVLASNVLNVTNKVPMPEGPKARVAAVIALASLATYATYNLIYLAKSLHARAELKNAPKNPETPSRSITVLPRTNPTEANQFY